MTSTPRTPVLVLALAMAMSGACLLPPVDASGRACDVDGACAAGFLCARGDANLDGAEDALCVPDGCG